MNIGIRMSVSIIHLDDDVEMRGTKFGMLYRIIQERTRVPKKKEVTLQVCSIQKNRQIWKFAPYRLLKVLYVTKLGIQCRKRAGMVNIVTRISTSVWRLDKQMHLEMHTMKVYVWYRVQEEKRNYKFRYMDPVQRKRGRESEITGIMGFLFGSL